MGLFDVVLENVNNKTIIKILVSSGNKKPYYIKKYGRCPEECYIRVGSSREKMTEDMIKQQFVSHTQISLRDVASPRQDLSFRQLKIFYENSNKSLDNDSFLANLGLLTEDMYYDIAKNNDGVCFRVTDSRWNELNQNHTSNGLWLINRAFLNYVIYKRWEIVLVSDPSVHYNLITQQKLSSRMYASELEYLCKYHGATWHSEVPYWRIDKAW